MALDCKPFLGSNQPALGADELLISSAMGTRKSKKDKGAGLMRAVVADNLRRNMERFYKQFPHITNRTKHLALEAEIGFGTIQRTLSCETGASVDTIEALARVLGIRPYELLKPSAEMRHLLSASDDVSDVSASAESLHRRRS